ncbi:hypothetical protein [Xanthobacter flavus]|uniref:hypothetical protein n=1 Tax=Xanthobacter flavus TaxID=281 RepID=UPI00372C5132
MWFGRHFQSRGLAPHLTVAKVSSRLFCPACREVGGRGKQLRVEAYPIVQQAEVA